jgi:hypothetical protein
MRPVATIRIAEMEYPIQTQIQACHQAKATVPVEDWIKDEAIIHVFYPN